MKSKDKPIIHRRPPEYGGKPLDRVKTWQERWPAKIVSNTRDNMDMLKLYTKGELKFEDTGSTCFNCFNYYPAAESLMGGRCKAKGFMDVHPETAATEKKNYSHPGNSAYFPIWPACPLFISKERLSLR